jgi:hypothetical protein
MVFDIESAPRLSPQTAIDVDTHAQRRQTFQGKNKISAYKLPIIAEDFWLFSDF